MKFMSITGFLAASILAFFPYLFFYWSRLREAYEQEKIFTSGIVMYMSCLVGGVLVGKYAPSFFRKSEIFDPLGLWFWGGVVFYFLSLFWVVFYEKLRFFEVFEASSVGLLYLYLFVFAVGFVLLGDARVLVGSLAVVLLIGVFYVLDMKYKGFSWYKSGRVGFSGLTTLGMMFLFRAIVAVINIPMISFVGKMDAVMSGALAFLLFFSVFNLSELL